MEEIEQGALQLFGNPVPVCKRNLDDTFVIVRRDRIDALREHLNNQVSYGLFSRWKDRTVIFSIPGRGSEKAT